MNQSLDLSSVLTGLLYGREAAESLEQTLDQLVAPNFVLRMNGQVYDRSGFAAHISEMRQMTAGGGEIRVLEQIGADNRTAGRYLLRMKSAEGRSLTVEAHVFATVNDGRVERLTEIARPVEDDAEENFLADT